MASKIIVDQLESSGSNITIPTGTGLVVTDGIAATNLSGTIADARLPTVPVAKGGTGLTSLGSAGQVVQVNSGGNALEFAAAAGGGAYEVVATADYSSAVANITLTNCFTSTYQVYKVIGHDISGASGNKLLVQMLDSGGSAISGWDHVISLSYVNEGTGGGGESHTSDGNYNYFKFMNYEFSGNTTNLGNFDWTFYQPYESKYTHVTGRSIIDANNDHTYGGGLSAVCPSTTSGRSLKFYLNGGGNFSSYKITVLGMKRS